MKDLILYFWQLPQNLLGLFLVKLLKAKKNSYYNVYTWRYYCGISLGKYIIIHSTVRNTDVKHEKGHQKQSLYLGWLYLLVIGLPSVIGNICWRVLKNFDYYKQPWEKWADKLGGVKR